MKIVCTVTNDLTTDQRMHRICNTLSQNGYEVTLIGRKLKQSKPLPIYKFSAKRLSCWATKGFAFYAEWNLRLFFYLLFQRFDLVYTVDLDTMPSGALASYLRRKKRFFDAHEYFIEVPEVTNRPFVKAFWNLVERFFIPLYPRAITVSATLAAIFEEKHRVFFGLVRNMPFKSTFYSNNSSIQTPKILLYQGALNHGRGIEQMLEAMQFLEGMKFWLAGEGDLSDFLRSKTIELGVENKVKFLGNLAPNDLKTITEQAFLGINLLENKGLSYYYSLANKFFDYVQACVPSLCIDFPEYRKLNEAYEVAYLVHDISPKNLAEKINFICENPVFYQKMQAECVKAREIWIWENEEKTLLKEINTVMAT
jgi:glycosyltransferase involved in cell wall biosynthesis